VRRRRLQPLLAKLGGGGGDNDTAAPAAPGSAKEGRTALFSDDEAEEAEEQEESEKVTFFAFSSKKNGTKKFRGKLCRKPKKHSSVARSSSSATSASDSSDGSDSAAEHDDATQSESKFNATASNIAGNEKKPTASAREVEAAPAVTAVTAAAATPPQAPPGFVASVLRVARLFSILFFVMTTLALLGVDSLIGYMVSTEGVTMSIVGVGTTAFRLLFALATSTGPTRTLLALGLVFFGDTVFHVVLFLVAVCFQFLRLRVLALLLVTVALSTFLASWEHDNESDGSTVFRAALRGMCLALHLLPPLMILHRAKGAVHALLQAFPMSLALLACWATIIINRATFLQLSNVGYNMLAWNIGWHVWGGQAFTNLYFCQDPRSSGTHAWATIAGCPTYSTHSAALNCLCRSNLNCANSTANASCVSFCDSVTSPTRIFYDDTYVEEDCLFRSHILFAALVSMAVYTFFAGLKRMAILSSTTALGLWLLNVPISAFSFPVKPIILPVASAIQRYISVPLTRLTGLDPTPEAMFPKGTLGSVTPWGVCKASVRLFLLFAYFYICASCAHNFLTIYSLQYDVVERLKLEVLLRITPRDKLVQVYWDYYWSKMRFF
jgi:hypothetical protein